MPIFERNFTEKFEAVIASWRVIEIQIISKAVSFSNDFPLRLDLNCFLKMKLRLQTHFD
jgi:hypothetical protein